MQSLNQQCLSHQSLDVDDIFLNLYLIKFDVDNFNFNLFYENLDYDNWSNRFISNKSDYWVLRCFQKYSQCNTYSLCQHLSKNIFGPEDMQKLNSTTIIVGSGDYHKLDSQEQAPKVVKLGIKNFPNDISQYVNGIYIGEYLDGVYIYAISLAYQNEGESVEVFKILDEHLNFQYRHSIIMDGKYN